MSLFGNFGEFGTPGVCIRTIFCYNPQPCSWKSWWQSRVGKLLHTACMFIQKCKPKEEFQFNRGGCLKKILIPKITPGIQISRFRFLVPNLNTIRIQILEMFLNEDLKSELKYP
jgi:hypothetical protein